MRRPRGGPHLYAVFSSMRCAPTSGHAAMAHTTEYSWACTHTSLRVTSAMQAGLTDRLWSIEDVVALVDTMAEPSKRRGFYKRVPPRPWFQIETLRPARGA